jgi:hypothetical protein
MLRGYGWSAGFALPSKTAPPLRSSHLAVIAISDHCDLHGIIGTELMG